MSRGRSTANTHHPIPGHLTCHDSTMTCPTPVACVACARVIWLMLWAGHSDQDTDTSYKSSHPRNQDLSRKLASLIETWQDECQGMWCHVTQHCSLVFRCWLCAAWWPPCSPPRPGSPGSGGASASSSTVSAGAPASFPASRPASPPRPASPASVISARSPPGSVYPWVSWANVRMFSEVLKSYNLSFQTRCMTGWPRGPMSGPRLTSASGLSSCPPTPGLRRSDRRMTWWVTTGMSRWPRAQSMTSSVWSRRSSSSRLRTAHPSTLDSR